MRCLGASGALRTAFFDGVMNLDDRTAPFDALEGFAHIRHRLILLAKFAKLDWRVEILEAANPERSEIAVELQALLFAMMAVRANLILVGLRFVQ